MNMYTRHHILQWITIFLAGCFVILCSILIAWALQPANVLVVQDDPAPVRPEQVDSGDGTIIATISYCKKQSIPGTVHAVLVGEQRGSEPQLAWPPDNSASGCVKTDVPIIIPAATQTDTYHAVFTISYRINPIKSQVVIFRTRSFNVVNTSLGGTTKVAP